MTKKTNDKVRLVTDIPTEVELFGRKITTIYDTDKLSILRNYGEARYGVNEIAINRKIESNLVSADELKSTYLHELLHFILNFTGYESVIKNGERIDIEQFVELVSSGIYQYEKSAKY